MDVWRALFQGLTAGLTVVVMLGLFWRFDPASRKRFPRTFPWRFVMLAAVGSGVLSSLAYGSVLYLSGAGVAWAVPFYGVGVGVTVVLGGIVYRWLRPRGA